MTKIVERKLPNGAVPFQDVADARTRDALMKLSENVVSLGNQVSQIAKAVVELQRK